MALRWVWAAVVVNVVSWLLLLSAIERTGSAGNRYAGYGVFVALYALALPAFTIVCAIAASLLVRGRSALSILGIVAAAVMAAFATMTAVDGAKRRAEARAREAQSVMASEQRAARLATMTTTELIAAVADPALAYDAAERLVTNASLWSAPCVAADPRRGEVTAIALAAARALGAEWRWSLESLHPIVARACPSFAAALLDAILDGAERGEASERSDLAVALRRRDAAWLRRAHARRPFSVEELARAEREAAAQ